ncbi:MAG: hypothetical protein HY082_05970 [Gammaproteobacteria bacterium]|nr:hypothetical protein [Gammaproteobacteria bacterium]
MNDASSETIGLSFKEARSEAKIFGVMSVVFLAITLLVPVKIIAAFAFMGLVGAGSLTLFHGATAVSLSLTGAARRWFQLAVSIVVPLVLSLYFLRDTPSITIYGLFGHLLSPWFLIPFVLIGYISWAAADLLNREHPFRGFLIATATIFVICFMGHSGIYGETDYYSDETTFIRDSEAAERAVQTGRYFGQFLIYMVVSYTAMLIKLLKKKRNT